MRLLTFSSLLLGAMAGHGVESELAAINAEAITFGFRDGISILVSASQASDGQILTVNVSNPSHAYGDWCGVYPADADPKQTLPLKWTYMSPYSGPTYNTNGTGSITMQVYNIRMPLVFKLFSGGTSKAVLIANSSIVTFADYNEPLHPRVSPAGPIGAFAVSWTGNTTTGNPRVVYGTTAGDYSFTATATSATVQRSALCGAPANATGFIDLGVTHTATMIGLQEFAGQTIHYALVDDSHTTNPRDYTFKVPPSPGQAAYPLRFAAFGDLGRGSFDSGVTWREYGQDSKYTAMLLADDVNSGKAQFVHHYGDISYAIGYLQTWDEFLWMTTPFASAAPYLIGVGNHEVLWPGTASNPTFGNAKDSGGECNVVTTTLFRMPSPATTNAPWYHYSIGPVMLIVMSSEHLFTQGSDQYAWLAQTLSNINRTATPWVIVTLHRPMYIDSDYSGPANSDISVMNLMQQHIEPLTAAAKVSLMLYGHNHRAERISAAFANKTVLASTPYVLPDGNQTNLYLKPKATVHYVAGTGGADYTNNDCETLRKTEGITCEVPEWSEMISYTHGYLRLEAINATALSMEYVNSYNGSVIDRVLIIQDLEQTWVGPAAQHSYDGPSVPGVLFGTAGGLAGLAFVVALWVNKHKLLPSVFQSPSMTSGGASYEPIVVAVTPGSSLVGSGTHKGYSSV